MSTQMYNEEQKIGASEKVRIQIDLSTGTVEVETPADAIDNVFNKLNEFLPLLVDAYSPLSENEEPPNNESSDQRSNDAEIAPPTIAGNGADGKKNKRKGTSRRESYEYVDMGLDGDQRQELKTFFAEKAPKSQNDQIVTILYWLQHNKGSHSATINEIYTGFRFVDVPVPGKISSVLGNLVTRTMVKNIGQGKYQLTHVGEDHVKFKLPAPTK